MSRDSQITTETGTSRTWLVLLALVGLAWLVYFPALGYDYVLFDDPEFVQQNEFVEDGLRPESIRWAFTTGYLGSWIPMTWLSLMLDSEILGPVPNSYHLTNVILHAINVALLFALMRSMTGAFWSSAAVAALFAVHPLHVESVAWITERKDVLSLFLTLLALLAYARYSRRPAWSGMVAVTVLYILGLMAKPTIVTFPCVLLLLDVWPLRRMGRVHDAPSQAPPSRTVSAAARSTRAFATWKSLVVEKLPLFAASLFFTALTVAAQRAYGMMTSAHQIPFSLRALNALAAYGIYLRRLVWPSDLAIFYPHPAISQPDPVAYLAPQAAVGAVLLIAITAFAVRYWRSLPFVLIGWLWFLGTLFPLSGIVQSGHQQMADRYVYLPYIGLYVAIVWLAKEAASKWKAAPAVILALGIGALGFFAAKQVTYWKDSHTLFGHALEVTDRNYEMLSDYATTLDGPDAKVPYFQQAIAIDPKFIPARINLGFIRLQQAEVAVRYAFLARDEGRPEDAKAQFRAAEPHCREALEHLQVASAAKPTDPLLTSAAEQAQELLRQVESAR